MDNIQVIERAVALLEAISSSPKKSCMLNELAEATKLKKSTASRILCTLTDLGYLEQPTAKKGYKLGKRLFELTRDSLCPPPLLEAARNSMCEFSEKTGEYICLSVLRGTNRVILHRFFSTHTIQVAVNRASTEDNPYETASGRLLLAYLPDGRRESCIRQLSAPGRFWPEIHSKAELSGALAQLRLDGRVAFKKGDLVTLAVPLLYGGETFSLGVYVPSYRFQGALKAEINKYLNKLPSEIIKEADSMIYKKQEQQESVSN